MSTIDIAPLAPEVFETATLPEPVGFAIAPGQRADCCRAAQAVVKTVQFIDGRYMDLDWCSHHANRFERAGAPFGSIVVDQRAALDVKPGASA